MADDSPRLAGSCLPRRWTITARRPAGPSATASSRGTLDAVQSAVDNGRFDLEWFDKCPPFACLRANDRFETMRVRVRSRANAIRSALGIPVAV